MDDKVILKEGVSESELHSLYEKSKFGIRFVTESMAQLRLR
jgi:hypothetical protein